MEGLARIDLLPLGLSASPARVCAGLSCTQACVRDILLLKHLQEETLHHRHPFRAGLTPSTITSSALSPTCLLSSPDTKVCLKLQSTWSLTLANFNGPFLNGSTY